MRAHNVEKILDWYMFVTRSHTGWKRPIHIGWHADIAPQPRIGAAETADGLRFGATERLGVGLNHPNHLMFWITPTRRTVVHLFIRDLRVGADNIIHRR